jgi:two-component system C4-dicarboxylate transport sensor histidine kinase DctB
MAGGGVLVLAFRGAEVLSAEQLELLWCVANLLGTALSKAVLHHSVVTAHRRLEESQELWLRTHKSLALAQMSAGVAHELNTPLGAIRLSLESTLLAANENQRRRLQAALDACLSAQNIIERLGKMAQQGQVPGQGDSVDLVQLGRVLLEQLSPRIAKHGISAQLEGPSHLVCPLSRELAESLLVPLLLNAIEALELVPESGRRMLLRMGGSPQEVWWEVLDSGPGIPAEHYSRLFEPFFTTKRIGTNVGLGLSIVEQACRQVGATLSFSPCSPQNPPVGTKARIVLSGGGPGGGAAPLGTNVGPRV